MEKILGLIAISLGKKFTVYAVGRVSVLYCYFKHGQNYLLFQIILNEGVLQGTSHVVKLLCKLRRKISVDQLRS